MDKEIREILSRFLCEMRKDIWFFASCGALVGFLMIGQFRLREMGIAEGESWPSALFEDFVSFNAFGLIFIGLLGLGGAAAVLNAVGITWRRLENTVTHLESRLVQIASAIMSFTVGISVSALVQSLFTTSLGGIKLTVMILLFNAMLFVGFYSSALVARRVGPFDRWWASLLMLVFALGMAIWLVVRGSS